MKFFSNKFLISFLILTVLIYGFSAKQAEAKGVIQFVAAVVAIVIIIYVPLLAPYLLAGNVLMGVVAAKLFPCNKWTAALVGGIGGGVGAGTAITLADKKCGSTSQQGAAGSPTLQNQTATPIINSDKTRTCTTGFTLNYETIDALQYGIYRDGNLLSQGFLGDERTTKCETDEYNQPPSDCPIVVEELFYDEYGEPYYRYTYNEDGSVASKYGIKTYYKKEYYNWPSPHTSNFSYTDSGLAPNKDYKYEVILLDKNGTQYRYPQLNAYTECIKLDLKVNGSDEPSIVKVASNYVTINWITEGALSCSASGDWSGNKGPATGREELGKIARGTSNPGLGKTYNYSMTCQYPKDKTLTDSGSVTVFKYPECNFSADPAVIEVLPATSTLSWDCRYYGGTPDEGSDSCSINQGIGSVSPLNDSVSVRPSQETTYTLTCSTVDKTSDYQASVNIGFRPRVYEINPGAW